MNFIKRSIIDVLTAAQEAQKPKTSQLETIKPKEIVSNFKSNYNEFWKRTDAIDIRNRCPTFTPYIFSDVSNFKEAFGDTLSKFFLSHGSWKIFKQFEEIHITFLSVNVYNLRKTWNRRDIDLKPIFLNELRQAYVDYAEKKGYHYTIYYDVLVTDIWFTGHTCIIQIPDSLFPINYPQRCRVLCPEEYYTFRQQLYKQSII